MKTGNRHNHLLAFLAPLAIVLLFSAPVLAQDDGARAYWKAREGTYVVSFQYLRMDLNASSSQAFDPSQYIYPNSDTEANVVMLTGSWHMTLLNRPSFLAGSLIGGDVTVDVSTSAVPTEFLPPGIAPGSSFSQSSSGFSDPNVSLGINLFGTPPLKSGVDLLNYEPTWTLDAVGLLAFPVGQYDNDKLVNIGLNRWYGRVAFPFKYHFGVFDRGHMSSFELIPSVWLFAENDDFLGQTMGNDPLWQLEAHLTHDFTKEFFGSLDALYRNGFQSEITGVEVGDKLNIGNLGFTLNYQVSDNFAIRAGFSSNVFGDDNVENSMLRLQFVYAWNRKSENLKKMGRH